MTAAPTPSGKKLIFVGNSGVGKSFLANVAVGETVFDHKVSPNSVTSKVEVEDSYDAYGMSGDGALHIYNIPGLVEHDEENIVRNKKMIKEAFQKDEHLPTSVFFVFSVASGGRIANEDTDAWKAMSDFLEVEAKGYGATITVVVNNIPKVPDFDVYTTAVTQKLKNICGPLAHNIVFVPAIPNDADRDDFDSDAMKSLTNKMTTAITAALPDAKPLSVDSNKEIELNGDVLKRQNADLHKSLKEQNDKFDKQMKDNTETFQKALREQQESNARQMEAEKAEWQRKFSSLNQEIQQYREDIKKHEKELEEARKKGRGGGDDLDGILPLLLCLLNARDDSARQFAGPSYRPMPMMMDTPSGMGMGMDAVSGGRSGGGNLNWNQWRTAHANQGHVETRASQSAAFQAYKRGK